MHRYYVLSIAVSRAAHIAIETQHFPLQDSKQTQDIRSKADVTEPISLRTKRGAGSHLWSKAYVYPKPSISPFSIALLHKKKITFILQAEISKLILPMSLSTWGAATVCHCLLVKVML